MNGASEYMPLNALLMTDSLTPIVANYCYYFLIQDWGGASVDATFGPTVSPDRLHPQLGVVSGMPAGIWFVKWM
jgi:hypothetical protein